VKGFIQILTAVEKKEDAENIARSLVKRRLAACVQILGPISSTFLWEEKMEKTKEWLCLIKSKRNLYSKVESTIMKMRPYKIPETMAVPVMIASRSYLEWINSAVIKLAR
jgi:periplasmic divalent cation tolerance protein